MPTRGQQFPMHNTGYFTGTSAPRSRRPSRVQATSNTPDLLHESTHSVSWGAGTGAFDEELAVKHTYDASNGRGRIEMHNEHGPVATLGYSLQHAERATSLRLQPIIHTSMIDVKSEYGGQGLATHMMDRLKQAHPGVAHPASNHLTEEGAAWRANRVTKGQDNGERVGEGPWESDPAVQRGPRLFRPVEPEELEQAHQKKYDTKGWLMEPGHFDPHDIDGEDMEHDSWVTRKSKIKKVGYQGGLYGTGTTVLG